MQSPPPSTFDAPMRCGIVGTGMFAHKHAQAIGATEGMMLVSAVSRNRERCAAFVSQYGGQCEATLGAMLDNAQLDLVAICAPNEMHASLTQEILLHPAAPRLVIVEKPLCVSPEELERLAALPQNLRDRIVVDHTRRFDPACRRLQQMIAEGELGTLRSGIMRYHAAWMHKGVHMVDFLRMLVGDFICKDATLVGVDRLEDDPLITATLQSATTAEATIVCEGLYEHPYRMTGLECLFTAGRLRVDSNDIFLSRLVAVPDGTPLLQHAEHFQASPALASLQYLYASCAAFLQNGKREVLDSAGFDEACKTMALMFAVRAAAGCGPRP